MSRALITGITGQDGSYLAELLLQKGYEVHGLVRPTTRLGCSRIAHLAEDAEVMNRRLFIHPGDVTDRASLQRVLAAAAPDELYHLAAQSHVGSSFDRTEATAEATGLGTLRLLEAVRELPRACRVFLASSSEIFGRPRTAPQDEETPIRPATIYGSAKAFATHLGRVYREAFTLHVAIGILYNHESLRRSEGFVTQKICRAAAATRAGRQKELLLGSLTAQRDWGAAQDYVHGMWLALQHPTPEDFVFATGELHSVQQVAEIAFATLGLNWSDFVRQDPALLRPVDATRLVGNPAKAERLLGWKRTVRFEQVIREMTLAAAAGSDLNLRSP